MPKLLGFFVLFLIMIPTPTLPLPMFRQFLTALPLDGAIRIELVDNVPLLKVTQAWQKRLEFLLSKQQQMPLNEPEIAKLDKFEEIDDYLSLVNRLIRNMWPHGIMPNVVFDNSQVQ